MASKRKTKPAKKTKPAALKIEAGANRRNAAVLTRNLRRAVEKIEEQETLLSTQKNRLFDTYKNDTGRSKQAAKRILKLSAMDPVTRDTIIKDELEILEDLGMATDMPLFAEAAKEQSAVEAMEREQSMPGYIESLGRDAFQAKRSMDQHPFPADAADVIAKWEAGFTAAATAKDEADIAKREARAHARAAKKAEAEGAAAE